MNTNPDFVGDAVWALAWTLVDQKFFQSEQDGLSRSNRKNMVNSNVLMELLGREFGVKPRKAHGFGAVKKYATGLEWVYGKTALKKGIGVAVKHAYETILKYVDLEKLANWSRCYKGGTITTKAARKILILWEDCF